MQHRNGRRPEGALELADNDAMVSAAPSSLRLRRFSCLSPAILLIACSSTAQPPSSQPHPAQPPPSAATPAQPSAAPSLGKLDSGELTRLGELLNPVESEAQAPSPSEAQPPSAWMKAAPGQPRKPVRFSDKDKRDVVRVLCESRPVAQGRHGLTCDCPSYTELEGTVKGGDGIGLDPFFPGHFSGPGRDEVVVALSGCETGAGSSQTYGGRALVRLMRDGWARTYHSSGALGDCTSILSPAGRSRLICHQEGGHQGVYPVAFTLVAFDEVDGETDQQDTPILTFTSHTGGPSGVADPVYMFQVTRFAVLGKAQYEAGNERALAIEINVRSRVECVVDPKACAGVDTTTMDLPLRYRFDGSAFHLAPESEVAFAQLKKRDR